MHLLFGERVPQPQQQQEGQRQRELKRMREKGIEA
jgi:hypothetical protein